MHAARMRFLLACLLLSASCVDFDAVVAPVGAEDGGPNSACAETKSCQKDLVCIDGGCKRTCSGDDDKCEPSAPICIDNERDPSFCAKAVGARDACDADLATGFGDTDDVCNTTNLACVDGLCKTRCTDNECGGGTICLPATTAGGERVAACE
jgi:hypothetical protein